jgi:hypothetical protein
VGNRYPYNSPIRFRKWSLRAIPNWWSRLFIEERARGNRPAKKPLEPCHRRESRDENPPLPPPAQGAGGVPCFQR